MVNRWISANRIYFERPVLVMLFLGFASGLPLALTTGTLQAWLKESGVDLGTIGLFAVVGTPYSLKFAWAPVLDRVAFPRLGARFGRRRGWLVAIQLALIAGIVVLGGSDPVGNAWVTACLAVLVAFFSASQDIVIDAYRIESLEERQLGAGSALYVYGYRIAMVVSGAGALILADHLPWLVTYLVMAACMGLGLLTVLFSPEPKAQANDEAGAEELVLTNQFLARGDRRRWAAFKAWTLVAVVGPFSEFIRRLGWWAALMTMAFVILFKFADTLAGALMTPFLLDLGFSKTEIAAVTKVYGLATLLIGMWGGGLMLSRLSMVTCLWIAGILQALSNVAFILQAQVGYSLTVLPLTVAAENLAGGLGTTIFVAYLSQLCNVSYTATQYALLSSLMAVARTILVSPAGFIAGSLGWVNYYWLSTAAAIPGLLLLLWITRWEKKKLNAL